LQSGRSTRDVGREFGISGERARQVAKRLGVVAGELTKQRRADAAALAEASRKTTCVVCGQVFTRFGTAKTCSQQCRTALQLGRRYLVPGRYEKERSNSIAHKVRNGLPPRAVQPSYRWTRVDSKVRRALRAVGREELLGAGPAQAGEREIVVPAGPVGERDDAG
jgi:hypothetical protein